MIVNRQKNNPASFFRTFSTIHLAQVLGPSLFLLVVIYITPKLLDSKMGTSMIEAGGVAALLLVCGLLGQYLFTRLLSGIHVDQHLTKRLDTYGSAFIIRMALAEAPILLSVVLAMIYVDPIFLVLSVIGLIYLFTLRPKKYVFSRDLQLNTDEQQLMGLS